MSVAGRPSARTKHKPRQRHTHTQMRDRHAVIPVDIDVGVLDIQGGKGQGPLDGSPQPVVPHRAEWAVGAVAAQHVHARPLRQKGRAQEGSEVVARVVDGPVSRQLVRHPPVRPHLLRDDIHQVLRNVPRDLCNMFMFEVAPNVGQ